MAERGSAVKEAQGTAGDPVVWWEDYARADGVPAASYLLESGGEVSPNDLFVDASDYTSKAFCDIEVERLWPSVWQMACRTNDIPNIGDYVEYQIVDTSVLVVRNSSGGISAFRNACRHRGTALAEGSGHADCFVCPFHGWAYELDGTLKSIPADWDFEHLVKQDYGLSSCLVDSFDGWVFVNLDPSAGPLAEFLGDTVTRHLLACPSERMRKSWHYARVVGCNWKVMATAFFETYHVPRTHPTLIGSGGDAQSKYDSFGLHARLIAGTAIPGVIGESDFNEQDIFDANLRQLGAYHLGDGFDEGFDLPGLPDGVTARQFMAVLFRQFVVGRGLDLNSESLSDAELLDAILYFVFPNFKTFRNPLGHLAYRFRPNGHDPDSCIFEVMNLTAIPKGAPLERDAPLTMLDPDQKFEDCADDMSALGMLIDQDVDNGPRIQKGLHNLDQIALAMKQERNIVAFHRNLSDWCGLATDAEL